MAPSIIQHKTYNCEEAVDPENNIYNHTTTTKSPLSSHFNVIFSDDEDDNYNNRRLTASTTNSFKSSVSRLLIQKDKPNINTDIAIGGYIDPVLSSPTYHIHQADNALITLKQVLREQDGWKKTLKHKSGIIVHMKNGSSIGDNTPIFKGEAIIKGFTPQAIFYVIGMRKLWDEQYEDGNLIENLDEATSLTYEIMKPTITSKSRDFALVEKIDCSQNGTIKFVCTSVESNKVPRTTDRTRANIKLQGWVLEPLVDNGQVPVTKVTFVIQENARSWTSGLTNKTLARRPLVIAKIIEYLSKKAGRMSLQQIQMQPQLQPTKTISTSVDKNYNNLQAHSPSNQSPSAMSFQSKYCFPSKGASRHSMGSNSAIPKTHSYPQLSSNLIRNQRSTISMPSLFSLSSPISTTTPPTPPIPLDSPVLLTSKDLNISSSISGNDGNKRSAVSFAKHDTTFTLAENSTSIDQGSSSSSSSSNSNASNRVQTTTRKSALKSSSSTLQQNRYTYPDHRHPIEKAKSIQLLKKLTGSYDNWKLTHETENEKHFVYNDNDDVNGLFKGPFVRADGVIEGDWTAEQLCSVIHCYGSREIWDSSFEGAKTIERFSQKEYLVQWFLSIAKRDVTVVTSIETDPTTGAIYTASTSVDDQHTPIETTGQQPRVRAHTDLYGWVFKPNFDEIDSTPSISVSFVCNMDLKYNNVCQPKETQQSWIDNTLQSITSMSLYINQHGCPPYIRRVAGKVIQEEFDALTNHYKLAFIAKHEPFHSYPILNNHQQQQNPASSCLPLWCTEIRFDTTMFPYGLDIRAQPDNSLRIEIFRDTNCIRVYSVDSMLDGQHVTFELLPLKSHNGQSITDGRHLLVKCNGIVLDCEQLYLSPVKSMVTSREGNMAGNASSSATIIPNDTMLSPKEATSRRSSISSCSSSTFSNDSQYDTPSSKIEIAADVPSDVTTTDDTKDEESVSVIPTITMTEPELDTVAASTEKEKSATVTDDEIPFAIAGVKNEDSNTLKAPKGDLIAPGPIQQSQDMLLLTNGLSFNGQQLSAIILAMVVCYYMGKFSACSSSY